ncbi:MAG: hypothetical protein VKI81_08925 [Synechococcaceae cyanobacterium]|nr:hypothetical protein [Synechococcaceae cyanobacterium]
MTSPSVSFRISRSTEDLAETIHALSQRLVMMEQRLEAMERQLAAHRESEPDPQEVESLARVDSLLQDCRDLLAAGQFAPSGETSLGEEGVAMEEEGATGEPAETPAIAPHPHHRGEGFAAA